MEVDPVGSMRNHLRMAPRIPTNLTLPRDLVAELDAVCGPRGRSAFVEEAVRHRLKRERLRSAWERAAGAWKGRGLSEWDEPDGVANWVRAIRSEVTDPGPDV